MKTSKDNMNDVTNSIFVRNMIKHQSRYRRNILMTRLALVGLVLLGAWVAVHA